MADNKKNKHKNWQIKRRRIKYRIRQKNRNDYPRLVVYRSNTNIYAQLVDDLKMTTLLSASSIDKDLKDPIEKAANKNLPAAQYNLGVMYANGDGVSQDYKAARTWYEKAAANNYTLAQFNLALMYFEGLGMPKNLEMSYVWNTIAEYNGNMQASHSRKLDERTMLPKEVAEAKEKADAIYTKILAGTYAGEGRLF